jgi:hypothetical protein
MERDRDVAEDVATLSWQTAPDRGDRLERVLTVPADRIGARHPGMLHPRPMLTTRLLPPADSFVEARE